MIDNDLSAKVDGARFRLEAQIGTPSVVHVSAANDEDGASTFASLLARSFAVAGTPTIVVSGVPTATRASASHTVENIDRAIRITAVGQPDHLTLDNVDLRTTADVRRLYESLRQRYAVSITSHRYEGGGVTSALASLADAVLISLLKGRSVRESDRTLNAYLASIPVQVLGAVFVDAATIRSASLEMSVNPRSAAVKHSGLKARLRLGA
jgi:hypothetical protein